MKIVVFADSHADVDTMYHVVSAERPDTILHLGDHIGDGYELACLFPDIPTHLVKGNSDNTIGGEYEKHITLGGKAAFVTHGHVYNVKSGFAEIRDKGVKTGADIVLFGHTHRPYLDYYNGIWLMNPGRIGRKSGNTVHATYGILRVGDGGLRCEIIEVKI